jgi:uncharacterized protein (DUF488 family)
MARQDFIGRRHSWQGITLYSVGHSTRSLENFLGLLGAAGIRTVADIRTFPHSRRHPHFDGEALALALGARQLRYAHVPRLGGRRRARPDSPNGAWRNESFRGYADYMLTAPFEAGLADLWALLPCGPVALLCAEAVPWRCHRFLVSDVLVARGAEVRHITGPQHCTMHRVARFARVSGPRVSYPAPATD